MVKDEIWEGLAGKRLRFPAAALGHLFGRDRGLPHCMSPPPDTVSRAVLDQHQNQHGDYGLCFQSEGGVSRGRGLQRLPSARHAQTTQAAQEDRADYTQRP